MGLCGVHGNEKADELARAERWSGAVSKLGGPNPWPIFGHILSAKLPNFFLRMRRTDLRLVAGIVQNGSLSKNFYLKLN